MLAAVCASVFALSTPSEGQGRAAQGESPLAARLKQQLGETFQINMLRIEGKSLQVASARTAAAAKAVLHGETRSPIE